VRDPKEDGSDIAGVFTDHIPPDNVGSLTGRDIDLLHGRDGYIDVEGHYPVAWLGIAVEVVEDGLLSRYPLDKKERRFSRSGADDMAIVLKSVPNETPGDVNIIEAFVEEEELVCELVEVSVPLPPFFPDRDVSVLPAGTFLFDVIEGGLSQARSVEALEYEGTHGVVVRKQDLLPLMRGRPICHHDDCRGLRTIRAG
jgi:hypothetical protein